MTLNYPEESIVKTFETFDEWYFETEMIKTGYSSRLVLHDKKEIHLREFNTVPYSIMTVLHDGLTMIIVCGHTTYDIYLYKILGSDPKMDLSRFTVDSIGIGLH